MNKTDSVSSLVIGSGGQIGSAIAKILECDGIERNQEAPQKSYEFLHICIGYSDEFNDVVKAYQEKYSPKYTVIHSTVPVGTCRKLNAVHSPCRGIHPELEAGIRTFVKYFGGISDGAYACAEQFKAKGVPTKTISVADDTEAAKLWDTTIYGINILLQKQIYKYCQENKLDFYNVYTHPSGTYNEGYEKLGHPEYKKYILEQIDGPIGGHCVMANFKLLGIDHTKFDTLFK